jgi:hypothetical protein
MSAASSPRPGQSLRRARAAPATLAALAVLSVTAGLACATQQPAQHWHPVKRAELRVTSGTISTDGSATALQTDSAEMRAVQRDGDPPATRARLWFQFRGSSPETKRLRSGLVRRQIGLKLLASDPCNLIYVMWRVYPDRAIEISLKRNPGLHTSQACGNAGYHDIAVIREPRGVRRPHVLEARTRRTPDGALALTVYADDTLVRRLTLGPDLTTGLEGPIGVRSDNGSYRFRLMDSV